MRDIKKLVLVGGTLLVGLVIFGLSVFFNPKQVPASENTLGVSTSTSPNTTEPTFNMPDEAAASTQYPANTTVKKPQNINPSVPTRTSISNDQADQDKIRAYEKQLADQQAALSEKQRLQRCQLIENGYPVYIDQEAVLHDTNVRSINSSYAQRGLYYSAMRQDEISKENFRDSTKIAEIEDDTRAQLAANSCT